VGGKLGPYRVLDAETCPAGLGKRNMPAWLGRGKHAP